MYYLPDKDKHHCGSVIMTEAAAGSQLSMWQII